MNGVIILGADGRPTTHKPIDSSVVEVVRSFSFKLNLGNYQSADFFCSQKAQCAPEIADEVSQSLYDWCFEEVMKSVRDVQKKQAASAASKQRSAA